MIEIVHNLILGLIGLGSGILTACGVFTVLIVIGMVPRFAGKTKTATKIPFYEDMVAVGAFAGNCLWLYAGKLMETSVWSRWVRFKTEYQFISWIELSLYGFFTGAFVGCLAVAVAEMIDGIPIVGEKIPAYIRKSFGGILVCMAIGKLVGSFLFFWQGGFQ